jgi:hypothetical protein
MTTATPGYRIKIERAKRHIRELADECQAFIAREPYSIYIENDASAGQRVWKVKIKECVPAEWSAIVGDAIHNIRASLDLLMVAVVRRCDPERQSYNHVHFVVRETKDEFETSLPKNIKGASAEARRLIEELKPYQGGNEALWRLHQLDVLDKHKAIVPVGSAYQAFGVTVDTRVMCPEFIERHNLSHIPPITAFYKVADSQFPLQDGAELFRAPLHEKLPFGDDVPFRFEVAFGEGQIVDGEPVIPALVQLGQFVEGTFEIFERHILK